VGFVIRDEHGTVPKAGAGRAEHLQSAFHAELLGCAAGLKAAACMGISAIMLEVDAVHVKMALEGDEYRLSSLGGVIMEIKLLLASELVGSSIHACPRSCNHVAHEFAVLGCNLPSGLNPFGTTYLKSLRLWCPVRSL
jgi:hypothetical protein